MTDAETGRRRDAETRRERPPCVAGSPCLPVSLSPCLPLSASVIIPSRNCGEILGETLRALSRQTLPAEEFEVVVVDDGSTDGTEGALRGPDTPFRLVYERVEPLEAWCAARPRNHGLRIATGEVAIFLDADILPCPELVARHVSAHAATQRPRAVIGTIYGYPLKAEERTPEAMRPPPKERVLEELPRLLKRDTARWRDGREAIYAECNGFAGHAAPWQLFWGGNVSVRRRLALEVGGFDEQFARWGGEDEELGYRLSRQGVEFKLARRAWGVHYPHPMANIEARKAVMQWNYRRLVAKYPEPQLEMQLWNPRGYAATWKELEAALTPPPAFPSDDLCAASAFCGRLRSERFEDGPVLLCGEAPPEVVARLQPAAWCRPLAPETGIGYWVLGNGSWEDTGRSQHPIPNTQYPTPVTLPLVGVKTPWEDAAFAGAIIVEYWRWIPFAVLAKLIGEMLRVAGRAVFLTADPTADASPARLPSLEHCAELLQWLAPGGACEVLRGAGMTAFIVTAKERDR